MEMAKKTKNVMVPMMAFGAAAMGGSVTKAAEPHQLNKPEAHVRDIYTIDWLRQAKAIGHIAAFERAEASKRRERLHIKKHIKPLSPAQVAANLISPTSRLYKEWVHVDSCEESGDWHQEGSIYGGGLGIKRSNWTAYGGAYFSRDEAAATPQEQMVIGDRIQFGATGVNPKTYLIDAISGSDWTAHGGLKFSTSPVKATMDERITVLQSIENKVPDPGTSCGNW